MANPFLLKSGVVALSAGGISVVGWQINNYLNRGDKTYSYLLKQRREKSSSTDDWKKIKDFYSSSETSELIPNIPKENVKEEDIKGWCSKELEKPLKEQTKDNLKLIETWCSKPRTLKEQIATLNKTILDVNTGDSNNPHKSKWDSNKEAYKKEGNKFKIKKKENSNNTWVDFEANSVTVEMMKEWCKDQSDKQYKHPEDSTFNTFQNWCSQ
ncbi:hypothetical protein MHC_03635 [Mycoplasma haemocanis str. Illinois]|uniref:Uncharacterized protein n=1 Tax=Mycoplasma haemocanis (strain Illinois) TaxID=1111676 RepID=H6N7G5_MYCHN|nr:hypothetical protein [Mycoplasma haemocanis]AEW45587.1 hypothetical protein MHC_03635 [Mycoplasma haemocanis str. Illinois]